MTNDNEKCEVINLPLGDNRAAMFTEDLVCFIREQGWGLPFPTVLGCIDIAKYEIIKAQDE